MVVCSSSTSINPFMNMYSPAIVSSSWIIRYTNPFPVSPSYISPSPGNIIDNINASAILFFANFLTPPFFSLGMFII